VVTSSESVVVALQSAGLRVSRPGQPDYADATSPENGSVTQHPIAVAHPTSSAEAAAVVRQAAASGLVIAVQGTGHGAARSLGCETLLVDSRALSSIEVDPVSRIATVGAGAEWGPVQEAAEKYGLLSLAGTSPLVGVSGYTFGGGVGWLTRPHGLASAALRSVEFVDGEGVVREATEDAEREEDREALWAFRGGQPVGIATSLQFDLAPVPDLYAGYLLWPAADARAVVPAWAAALDALPSSVTSTMALLQLPPDDNFPPELRNSPAVHLSFASTTGADACSPLLDAVRAAAAPAVDTAGPSGAERLAGIHLDPPPGQPSRGVGRWLTDDAAARALDLFAAARIGESDGLRMIEVRHVAADASPRAGALTTVPAPFLMQGLGDASPEHLQNTEAALQRVERAAEPVDAGRAFPSFATGSSDPGAAFPEATAVRLATAAARLDPHGIFRFERAARESVGD
jgi:FAD/FMN-containing dehydrogenase